MAGMHPILQLEILESVKITFRIFCGTPIQKKQISTGASTKAEGIMATTPDSFLAPINGGGRGVDAANENVAISVAPTVTVARPFAVECQSSQAAINSACVAWTMTADTAVEAGALAANVSAVHAVQSASAQVVGSRSLALAVRTSFLICTSRNAANVTVYAMRAGSHSMHERRLDNVAVGSAHHGATGFPHLSKAVSAVYAAFNNLNSPTAITLRD